MSSGSSARSKHTHGGGIWHAQAAHVRPGSAGGAAARDQHHGRGREGHPRPEGPERRHRQEVRQPHDHQGRCHRGQGSGAEGSQREHGSPDDQGGGLQDLGRGWGRHHNRDRAGPGDLPGGPEERDGGGQPDGAQAGHRAGGRGGRRRSEDDVEGNQGQEGDRPGRDRRRQQRQDDREPDRRGDGEGREGRGHHGRRGQGDGDDPRSRRGDAVRPGATCRRTWSRIRSTWRPSSRTP